MAIGKILYSTSSTTISSGDVINASDFEQSTSFQVDSVTGNLTITGGINSSGISNLGSIENISISSGVSDSFLTTDGSGNLSWNANTFLPTISEVRDTYAPVSGLSTFTITGIPDNVRKITILGANVTVDTTSAVGNIQIGNTTGIYTDTAVTIIGTYSYISNSNIFNTYLWPSTISIPLLENDRLTFAITLENTVASPGSWNVIGEIMNYNYNGTGVGNIVTVTGTINNISLFSPLQINQVKLNTSSGTFSHGLFSVMYET